jgi:hypothetical protein
MHYCPMRYGKTPKLDFTQTFSIYVLYYRDEPYGTISVLVGTRHYDRASRVKKMNINNIIIIQVVLISHKKCTMCLNH